MNWRHRYRAWIVPYAEGTLDARRRARLEAWLARDPVLAAEAEAERRVVARLRTAAQDAESPPNGRNLWPGIQSRLEARRPPVRPLFLVGGLSAAATSLAWAALWGPLHHPAQPPVAVATNTVASNVIVVGPMPGHHHGHPPRRLRHGTEHPTRHQTPAVPEQEHGGESPATTRSHRMAQGTSPSPMGGSATTETSPSVSVDTARFHLAASVQPVGHGDAHTEQGSAVLPEDDMPPSGGRDTGALETTTPTVVDTQVKPVHTAMTHRRHRHHHLRRSGGVKTTKDIPKETTDAVGNAASPAEDTPAHPKDAHKPID